MIIRLDTHSDYPKDYIIACLETTQRTGAQKLLEAMVGAPGPTP
jgi:hypothetical protein